MLHRTLACLVTLATASPMGTAPAWAACSTIPPLARYYPSTLGGVTQRSVVPTLAGTNFETFSKVTVVRRADCTSEVGPLFSADPKKNHVTITLKEPMYNDLVVGTVDAASTRDCEASGCRTLVFTMPTTASDGSEVVGPVFLTVKVDVAGGLDTAAQIDTLYQAADQGCDKLVPDEYFDELLALPTPNDVTTIDTNGARMVLGPGENVFIPLDHRNARPANELGYFEQGQATFCARSKHPLCHIGIGRRSNTQLRDTPDPETLLQTFSLDGQLIAPVLRLDDEGDFFGIADAAFSVIRVRNDTEASGKRFELGSRRQNDTGPVSVPGSTWDGVAAKVCNDGRMGGLRATPHLLAHVRQAGTLQIHDATDAGRTCPAATTVQPANTTLAPGRAEPVVEAEGNLVATIEANLLKVRAFDGRSADQTDGATLVATDPSNEKAVNRYPLAVLGGRVWYRNAAAALQMYVPGASATTAVSGTTRAEIAVVNDAATATPVTDATGKPKTRAVGLGTTSTDPAWYYEAGSARAALADAGTGVANAGDAFALIKTSGDVAVWSWPPGATAPVATAAPNLPADEIGATPGCWKGKCRSLIVVLTRAVGGDRTLRLYDPHTPTTDPSHNAALDFVAGERAVAFRLPESALSDNGGGDRDGSGGIGGAVMFAFVLDGQGSIDLVNTGLQALGQDGDWARLGWRTPYLVTKDAVLFLTPTPTETALVVFSLDAKKPIFLKLPPNEPVPFYVFDNPAWRAPRLWGRGLALGDADGDGVLDPADSCETQRNRLQFDDDYDGIGNVCDALRCSDYAPPTPRGERLSPSVGEAAVAYLKVRAQVTGACLERVEHDPAPRRPESRCRGSFTALVENRPTGLDAAGTKDLDRAERAVLASFGRRNLPDGRRVLRAYGEAVNAVTRATYGNRVRYDPAVTELRTELGRTATMRLAAVADAMRVCVSKRRASGTRSSECLGALADGKFRAPYDEGVAGAIAEMRKTIQPLVTRLEGAGGAHLCGARTKESGCVECTVWRNAVRATLSLLDAASVESVDLEQRRDLLRAGDASGRATARLQ